MKFLLLFLLLSTPALARMGETREQCDARYGEPIRPAFDAMSTVHQKAGIEILCHFHEGKCDAIDFSRVGDASDGQYPGFSKAAAKALMEASSAGKPWSLGLDDPQLGFALWHTEGLDARPVYEGVCRLSIMTTGHTKRLDDERKAREDSKVKDGLKGF